MYYPQGDGKGPKLLLDHGESAGDYQKADSCVEGAQICRHETNFGEKIGIRDKNYVQRSITETPMVSTISPACYAHFWLYVPCL